MRSNSVLGFTIALIAVLGGSMVSTAAFGNDTILAVSSLPEEFVIGDPASPNKGLEIQVLIQSASDQELIVEFVDFFFDDKGNRTRLPGGSTPYSLENALEIMPFESRYEGKGTQQSFTIKLSPKAIDPVLMYTGGVNIRLKPLSTGSASTQLSQASSVLSSLIVSPYGIAGKLAEGTLVAGKITRHDLNRLDRSSFIDSIVPDIPGIVNYGAVESVVYYENQGQYPVFTTLNWEFTFAEEVIASRSIPKSILGSGVKAKKSVATQVKGQSESVLLSVLPSFGFISNKITLKSTLGGTELPAQVYDGSFLVLQWKEPFVGVLTLYFFIRWAWRRNLTPRQKAEKASLITLGIQSLLRGIRPKPAANKAENPAQVSVVRQASTSTSTIPKTMYVPPGASYPGPNRQPPRAK